MEEKLMSVLPKDLLKIVISYSDNPNEAIILMDKSISYNEILKDRFGKEAENLFKSVNYIKDKEKSFKSIYGVCSVIEKESPETMLDKMHEFADHSVYKALCDLSSFEGRTKFEEKLCKIVGKLQYKSGKLWFFYKYKSLDILEKEFEIFGPCCFVYRILYNFNIDLQHILFEKAFKNVKLRNDLKKYYQEINDDIRCGNISLDDEYINLIEDNKYKQLMSL